MILASTDWLTISINLLLIVFVITALLMSLLILMQRPKQEGLGAAFGSGMTDQMFGARTTNVLQKGTVYLGSLFFILTLTLAILFAKRNDRDNLSSLTAEEPAAEEQSATPAEETPEEEAADDEGDTPSLEESLEGQLESTSADETDGEAEDTATETPVEEEGADASEPSEDAADGTTPEDAGTTDAEGGTEEGDAPAEEDAEQP